MEKSQGENDVLRIFWKRGESGCDLVGGVPGLSHGRRDDADVLDFGLGGEFLVGEDMDLRE
jgi:hypothetical protein